jgi:hypothetical protein
MHKYFLKIFTILQIVITKEHFLIIPIIIFTMYKTFKYYFNNYLYLHTINSYIFK